MVKQTVTESRPRPGRSPYWLGAGRRDIVGWIILRIGRALDEDWAGSWAGEAGGETIHVPRNVLAASDVGACNPGLGRPRDFPRSAGWHAGNQTPSSGPSVAGSMARRSRLPIHPFQRRGRPLAGTRCCLILSWETYRAGSAECVGMHSSLSRRELPRRNNPQRPRPNVCKLRVGDTGQRQPGRDRRDRSIVPRPPGSGGDQREDHPGTGQLASGGRTVLGALGQAGLRG